MPVAMRLQAYRHLAELLLKIGQLVEFTPMSVPEGGDVAPDSEEAE